MAMPLPIRTVFLTPAKRRELRLAASKKAALAGCEDVFWLARAQAPQEVAFDIVWLLDAAYEAERYKRGQILLLSRSAT